MNRTSKRLEDMDINIWPWKPGDKGSICLPLKRNVPDPHKNGKHNNWQLVNCPICGAECWESDLTREAKMQGNHGACTECALRNGMRQ